MAGETLQAEPKAKNKGGRPRLSIEEKRRRGTLQPWRERARLVKEQEEKAAVQKVIEFTPDAEAKQDYIAVLRRYMGGVRDGSIVAGKWVKLAVERQFRDEARAAALHASGQETAPADGWDFAFSSFFAVKACAFIEDLPHVEGRWQSPKIHLEPWQVFVVCVLFGWRHRSESLRRRFTVLYLELARKNAKSTLAAATPEDGSTTSAPVESGVNID